MTHVTLSGYIRVPLADLEAVQSELPTHIALTRAESGCLRFSVEQDDTDPTVFHVDEEFIDSTAFKNHQTRVRTSHWAAVSINGERHYTIAGLEE